MMLSSWKQQYKFQGLNPMFRESYSRPLLFVFGLFVVYRRQKTFENLILCTFCDCRKNILEVELNNFPKHFEQGGIPSSKVFVKINRIFVHGCFGQKFFDGVLIKFINV